MRYTFLLFLLFSVHLNAQTVSWAVGYGNTNHLTAKELDVDATGNVAVVGQFRDTVDFDPDTLGVHKIGAIGATSAASNLYIQKLDVNGNFLWVKQLVYNSGTSQSNAYKVKFDAAGNIFVSGGFTGTVDFDPGPATQNVSSTSGSDGYLLKLDANGNFLWVKTIEGNSADYLNDMEIDNSGNIYLAGTFFSTTDLDPGVGVQQFTSQGSYDIFLTKWDANGNHIWSHTYGGTGYDDPSALQLDNNGNAIITGKFQDTAYFDPGPGTMNLISASGFEGFVLKVDASGNTVFAKQITERYINEVATDNDNNIILTGRFTGTVDFDPNAGVSNETSNGNLDAYLVKWDSIGNYVWSTHFGSSLVDVGVHVVTDNFNRIFTIGYIGSTADFDPGPNNFFLSTFNSDAFLSILDGNGNFIDAKRFASSGGDKPYAMVNKNNCIYAVGTHANTIDFAPLDGHYYVPHIGATDGFVLKFCYSAALPIDNIELRAEVQEKGIDIHWTTYEEKNMSKHIMQWSSDGIRFEDITTKEAKNNSVNEYEHLFSPRQNQNYFRIKSVDIDGSISFSKIVLVQTDDRVQLKVYPNPARHFIETGHTQSGWTTEIFNLMGQRILFSKERRINIESLTTGTYILIAKRGSQTKYARFIKE